MANTHSPFLTTPLSAQTFKQWRTGNPSSEGQSSCDPNDASNSSHPVCAYCVMGYVTLRRSNLRCTELVTKSGSRTKAKHSTSRCILRATACSQHCGKLNKSASPLTQVERVSDGACWEGNFTSKCAFMESPLVKPAFNSQPGDERESTLNASRH